MTRLYLRLALDRLVIGPDHPPGLDLKHVRELAEGEREDDRLLLVAPIIGTRPLLWQVLNGRHRYVAALAAGESEVLAEVTLPYPPATPRAPWPGGESGRSPGFDSRPRPANS